MKWAMVLLGLGILGCAKNSSVVVEHGPLAPYAQIAVSLREDVGGLSAVRSFYEKLGFAVIKEEDIDIGNGYFMIDFVMEKKL